MSPSTRSSRPARRPTRATFSDEVRDAVDRDGRTPHGLATAAGISPAVISRFLAGQRGITSDTLDRLAEAMGLHLAAVTRGRGRPRKAAAVGAAIEPGDAPGEPLDVPEAGDAEGGPDGEQVDWWRPTETQR